MSSPLPELPPETKLQSIDAEHDKIQLYQDLEPSEYMTQSVEQWRSVHKSNRHTHQKDVMRSKGSFSSSISTFVSSSFETRTILPEKRYSRILRNLRWTILSVYRRLYLSVVVPNVVAMIILGSSHQLLILPHQIIATAVSINIAISILIRQELLINLLLIMVGSLSHSLPLRVRRLAAKIYHLGGIHSGSAIAATIWFGLFNASLIKMYISRPEASELIVILVITSCIDILLLSIVILAHPTLRNHFHNTFEVIHRFAGWTTVLLFWVHMVLLSHVSRKGSTPSQTLIEVIIKSPTFYCLLIITISLILPWLKLKKESVLAEPLSDHAIRLHFTYANLPLCTAPRISDNPLKEWHSFAGIPEDNGNGYSMLVSQAGDWTKKIIQSPPDKIWIRGIPTRGVLHVAPIFQKLILVATGSGIGPILALLHSKRLNCRILWSTPDPEKTYGRMIVDRVYFGDPDAVIINTTLNGRPDLILEAYKLYDSTNAEAVFVISNPRVTRKVVYGLECRGVPVFAPIFDS